MKRVVVPGYPHHIVQRGVRSMDVFSSDEDREAYLRLLREQAERFGVVCIAYCLMSNHIHLLAVPEKPDGLARAVGEAHRRYTRMVNERNNVTGFLFQGRFYSCPVDRDEYLLAAVRYIEMNPVKAGLAKKPWKYKWSSARFHCGKAAQDPLVQESVLLPTAESWKKFLAEDPVLSGLLEEKIRTGRPFGRDGFYSVIEKLTGEDTRPGLPGRPMKR